MAACRSSGDERAPGRPHLDGGVVGRDRGDVQVPQGAGRGHARAAGRGWRASRPSPPSPRAGRDRYQPSQPVRISSTSPGSDSTPSSARQRTTSSGSMGSGWSRASGRPSASSQRPTSASTPRPTMPRVGPVVDAVVLLVEPAVEPVDRVRDVAEAVPLRARLRVPAVEHVVVVDRRRVALAGDRVLHRHPPEHRRVDHVERRVEGEHRTPSRPSLAASTTRSGVSRLRQPSRSPSPHKPHDDPGGAPSTTGRSAWSGSGVRVGHARILARDPRSTLGRRVVDLPKPMKAVSGTLPDDDDGWAYEIKWDGMRVVSGIDDGIRGVSTRGLDVIARFPEMEGLADHLRGHQVVLDGEVVAFDGHRTDFGRLQHRMHVADRREALRRAGEAPVVYVVFDLLHLDGIDTMPLAYEDRRRVLLDLVEPGERLVGPAPPDRRRRGVEGCGRRAGPRGRGGQAAGVPLRARPALARLAQGEGPTPPGAGGRRVDAWRGQPGGVLRRAARRAPRRGRPGRAAGVRRLGRHRVRPGRADPPPRPARRPTPATVRRSATRCRRPSRASAGSSPRSSWRWSSPSGRPRVGCATPPTSGSGSTPTRRG